MAKKYGGKIEGALNIPERERSVNKLKKDDKYFFNVDAFLGDTFSKNLLFLVQIKDSYFSKGICHFGFTDFAINFLQKCVCISLTFS